MESIPKEAMVLISILPLIGLGLLTVVLLSLGLKRDRWIVPGMVMVVLAAAGWGTATEFGGKVNQLIAKAPESPPAAANPSENSESPPEEPTAPASPAASASEPGTRTPMKNQPGNLVPVPVDPRKYQPEAPLAPLPPRGPTVVVVPPTPSSPVSSTTPMKVPAAAPAPVADPPAPVKPAATAVKPVETPPAPVAPAVTPPKPAPPAPTPTVAAATPKPAPTTPPAPVKPAAVTPPKSSGERGTLMITIRGTVMKNSSRPASGAHMMFLLDGKKAETRFPTRTQENHQDKDPAQPILAYDYFWENVSVTFSGLEPGYHAIMIGTSLESPGSHQAMMTGAGQGQNSYNGMIEIKAGETTVMEFSNNSFNTGLIRTR